MTLQEQNDEWFLGAMLGTDPVAPVTIIFTPTRATLPGYSSRAEEALNP